MQESNLHTKSARFDYFPVQPDGWHYDGSPVHIFGYLSNLPHWLQKIDYFTYHKQTLVSKQLNQYYINMKKELEKAISIAGKIIDNWLPIKIMYDHTPGAVICIATDGKTQYLKAFGKAHLSTNTLMKPDHLFRIASISKMFTAVAILQLQEQGKIKLDDTVSTYLPWFTEKNKNTDLSAITIRQLLSHQSGIFRDGKSRHWVTDKFPKSVSDMISKNAIIFDNNTTLYK